MQLIAPDDMNHTVPVKNHTQAVRIAGMLQIHLKHTGGVTYLILKDGTKPAGNTLQSPDKVRCAQGDGVHIP